MNQDIIRLDRSFSIISKDSINVEDDTSNLLRTPSGAVKWNDLEKQYRVIILADAGAGKTVEMRSRAELIQNSGRLAFFIRIENLMEEDFGWAFEVGSSDDFNEWLVTAEEAWFFLDSVDEARLTSPGAFNKAINRFSNKIKKCTHRAHIYISGRPYSWHFTTDRELVEHCLSFSVKNNYDSAREESSLVICKLNSLTFDDIRFYAVQRCVQNAAEFINAIERANLNVMASRPLDLDFLIATWRDNGRLGSRMELFERNVKSRLDEIDPSRRRAQPLNAEKALKAASLLAGAVTFTGKSGIKIYDRNTEQVGVDAEVVLSNWEPQNVWSLLERGIFSDAIYNMVGFRHREIRDYLSARWLSFLLKNGHSRRTVESLIFREIYGIKVIAPRLSTLIPWLVLMDNQIRDKILHFQPEIVLTGGDVSHLPLLVRIDILTRISDRIANNLDEHNVRHNSTITLMAKADLVDTITMLIDKHYTNDDVILFLSRLLCQINLPVCLDRMICIATDCDRGVYTKIGAIRVIMTTASDEEKNTLWQKLNTTLTIFPLRLLSEIVSDAAFNYQSVSYLLVSLSKLEPYKQFDSSGLAEGLTYFIEKASQQQPCDGEAGLVSLLSGFYILIKNKPFCEQPDIGISKEYVWLIPFSIYAIEKLVLMRSNACFHEDVLDLLLAFAQAKEWHSDHFRNYKGTLFELVPKWPELNDTLFWRAVENRRAESFFKDKRLIDDWPVQCLGHFFNFDQDSFKRITEYVTNKQFLDDKLVSLSLALRIYRQSDNNDAFLCKIKQVAKQHAELEKKVEFFLNPPHDTAMEKMRKQDEEHRRLFAEQRARYEDARDKFIQRIKATPNEIRNPSGLDIGEVSNDQYLLCQELTKGNTNHLAKDIDWHKLTEVYGIDVAIAFRDAIIGYWRIYQPALSPEDVNPNSIPFKLIFGLLGLEAESKEREDFPYYFSEEDVERAILYATKEINGFPDWLEKIYFAFPDKVATALWENIEREFKKCDSVYPVNQILHDIVHRAPWCHSELTSKVYQWLKENEPYRTKDLRNCLRLLISGDANYSVLAELASSKIEQSSKPDNLPAWFALYADICPDKAIPELGKWLEELPEYDGSLFAQHFLTTLTGKIRDGSHGLSFTGNVRNPSSLKALFSLMIKYIKPQDDIDRTGGCLHPNVKR